MKLVRIVRDYKLPDLMRQTPGNSGVWDGIRFTMNPVEECDYLVVLNIIPEKITIRCPRQNIWALMQEPPIMGHKRHHRGVYRYQRIYTQDINLRNRRHIFSPPFYPWYIDRNYDELSNCRVPD